MLKQELQEIIKKAVKDNFDVQLEPQIERPREEGYGDYSSNAALILFKKYQVSRQSRGSPKAASSKYHVWKTSSELAEEIVKILNTKYLIQNTFDKVEIAGPGFINFYISSEYLQSQIPKIIEEGKNYGSSTLGKGKKARVEFVSANPTGPLHFGNARGGPIGDAIANVLSFSGFTVLREYLDNDRGNQVLELGKTIAAKAGLINVLEEELTYKGEYTKELAEKLKSKIDKDIPDEEIIEKAGELGVGIMFEEIIKDCEAMGIKFDKIVHESELQKEAPEVLDSLEKRGLIKKYEGATWFAPNDEYLKDKDAVVVKSDGIYTYFATDIVYHTEKFSSGYDLVIDVFGSNTSGHVPKLKALAAASGLPLNKFIVIMYQFVRIKRGSDIVKMSKRAGNFVTVKEVVDEVGKDALRFFILSTRPETHMDFDLELAKKKANENPVFYVQYANARISSILANSKFKIQNSKLQLKVQNLLKEKTELDLIRELTKFPELINEIAGNFEVHKLTTYATSLADKFHRFYEAERVISEDEKLTNARLELVKATQITLQNTFNLLGISAPEKM